LRGFLGLVMADIFADYLHNRNATKLFADMPSNTVDYF
jgi:hypothetical protein